MAHVRNAYQNESSEKPRPSTRGPNTSRATKQQVSDFHRLPLAPSRCPATSLHDAEGRRPEPSRQRPSAFPAWSPDTPHRPLPRRRSPHRTQRADGEAVLRGTPRPHRRGDDRTARRNQGRLRGRHRAHLHRARGPGRRRCRFADPAAPAAAEPVHVAGGRTASACPPPAYH